MLDTTTSGVTYRGGEGQSVFPIPFPFLETAHIRAHIRSADGSARALTAGVDYSVNRISDANGELILLGDDLPGGAVLAIARLVPLTQEILFHNQGPNSPRAMEEAVDKLTMIAQQLQNGLENSLPDGLAGKADAVHAHAPDAIEGLNAALAAKLDADDPRLDSLSGGPAAHAATHAAGGADAIRPGDIGALPAPPSDGKPYLAAGGGWIEYVAPSVGTGGEGGEGGGGGTADHSQLMNRDAADQHPQSAIQSLVRDLAEIRAGLSSLERADESLSGQLAAKADASLIPDVDPDALDRRMNDLENSASGLAGRIDSLGAMARAADAPHNDKPHMRQNGGWVEYAEPSGSSGGGAAGGGAIPGEIRFLPFRRAELPGGWYFCNGDAYPLSTPQGSALNSLPATMKTDWGIVVAGGAISLPNLLSAEGGYFIRAVDSASRYPGSRQADAIRNITGSFAISPAAGAAWVNSGSGKSAFSGALKAGAATKTHSFPIAAHGYNAIGDLLFDASACVATANENRPMNIGMTPAIYLGV